MVYKAVVNAITLFDRLSQIIASIDANLSKLDMSTIDSLERVYKTADAKDLRAKLYNEMHRLEDALHSLGPEELGDDSRNEAIAPLYAMYKKVKELRVKHNTYLNSAGYMKDLIAFKAELQQYVDAIKTNLQVFNRISALALQKLGEMVESDPQLLLEKITLKMPARPAKIEGHELNFMIERVSQIKNSDHYDITVNPLQYAAYLGCVPAVAKFCSMLAKENISMIGLTGDYGVIALSRATDVAKDIIPLVVMTFTAAVPTIIEEAIGNDDYRSIEFIARSQLPISSRKVKKLFDRMLQAGYVDLSHKTITDLAVIVMQPLDDRNKRESLYPQLAKLKPYGHDHDGVNMLMIIELLQWAKRQNALPEKDGHGQNLLHALCRSGHDLPLVAYKFCELTAGEHSFANQQDDEGNLALHHAVENNMLFSTQALLANTANINTRNKKGQTALHIAAEQGNSSVINLLFSHGADVFAVDGSGQTAYEIILRRNAKIDTDHRQQEELCIELGILDKLQKNPDKSNSMGLLITLKEALLEYSQLIAKEREPHVLSKIEEINAKVKLLKAAVKKSLDLKVKVQQHAELIGVARLWNHQLRAQQHLQKKNNDVRRSVQILKHYTRPSDEQMLLPLVPLAKREIKYTVFKGGGPKGTAHVGAILRAIEAEFIDPSKQLGTAGTSAGGIFALLFAVRYTIGELKIKLFNLDFMSFLDDIDRNHTADVIRNIAAIKEIFFGGNASWVSKIGVLKGIGSFLESLGAHKSGLFEGESLTNYLLDQVLAKVRGTEVLDRINVALSEEEQREHDHLPADQKEEYLLRKKVRLLTFQDFADFPEQFLQFKCFGTNISTQRGEEYSVGETPNATILSAMRITWSLPFIYTPAYLEERVLVKTVAGRKYYKSHKVDQSPRIDGGFFDNFPVHAFDRDPKTGVEMYNPEVLGFCLVPPEQVGEFARSDIPHHGVVDDQSFVSYMAKMLLAVMFGQQDYCHGRGIDRERTVYVSTLDVGTLDFNIEDSKKQSLVDNGGVVGMLDYEGSHKHTLEPVSISDRMRKRLIKNGLYKEFNHNGHIHSRFEPGHLLHPIEVLKLYAKADENNLPTLAKLVNPNTRDANGITALHIAKALGFKETYRRLVQYQANQDAESKQGIVASLATWPQIRNKVGIKTDRRSQGRLPGYLFDQHGDPLPNAESAFIQPKKLKLYDENRRIREETEHARMEQEKQLRALHGLNQILKEGAELARVAQGEELQALRGMNRQVREEAELAGVQQEYERQTLRAANQQIREEAERARVEQEKESQALRDTNQQVREEAKRTKVELEINLRTLRDANQETCAAAELAKQRDQQAWDVEKAELTRRITELNSGSSALEQNLRPENLPSHIYKDCIRKRVIQKIRLAQSDKHTDDVNDALENVATELEGILNAADDLRGMDAITHLKTALVEKLEDIMEGEVENCVPLLVEDDLMAFLKGLVGVVLGVAGIFVPFAFEDFRNRFFSTPHVREMALLRDEVIGSELAVTTLVR